MPTNFFADMVREASQTTGTGPLVLSGAVAGHRPFAGTVPPLASFYYAIAGITNADEWEVGTGHMNAQGQLVRAVVAASSAAGALVDFGAGLKTVALTVGAGWLTAREVAEAATTADLAAVNAALSSKQPVSTAHADSAQSEAGDRVTLRRGAGWVNAPVEAFARRGADGHFGLNGAVRAIDGSAAQPGLAFASDNDSGVFSPGANQVAWATGGTERMRIAADGRVAIGTVSAVSKLELSGGLANVLTITSDLSGSNFASAIDLRRTGVAAGARLESLRNAAGGVGMAFKVTASNSTEISGAMVEAMRLDNLGQLAVGVGTTLSPALRASQFAYSASYRALVVGATSGNHTLCLNVDPATNNGANFSGSGNEIMVRNGARFMTPNAANAGFHVDLLRFQDGEIWVGGDLDPITDNVRALGAAAKRWSVVYAGTGTINTSDAREKAWRGPMSDAELRAASRIAREIGVFQWNDAVAEKGGDAARLHIGVRAQAVWRIMADEGLVAPIGRNGKPGATPYAFLCWDEWLVEGTRRKQHRFGVRTDQLAMFVAAAQEARIAALEARISVPGAAQ